MIPLKIKTSENQMISEVFCTQDRDRTGTPKNWCLRPARLPIPPAGHLNRTANLVVFCFYPTIYFVAQMIAIFGLCTTFARHKRNRSWPILPNFSRAPLLAILQKRSQKHMVNPLEMFHSASSATASFNLLLKKASGVGIFS